MFLHKGHFSKYVADDTALFLAKNSNQILSKNGKVIYGRVLEDGTCIDFSTTQKPSDTHVGVILGCEIMGTLAPMESLIDTGAPTLEEEKRSMEAELKRLREENNQLRGIY